VGVEKREKCPYGLDVDAVILEAGEGFPCDPWVMEMLLFKGFRRYGSRFFRPRCSSCFFCALALWDWIVDKDPPENSEEQEKNRDVVVTNGPVEETPEKMELMEHYLAYFYSNQPRYQEKFRESIFQLRESFDTLEICYRSQSGKLLGYAIIDMCRFASYMVCFIHDPQESDRLLEAYNLEYLKNNLNRSLILYVSRHVLMEAMRRRQGYLYAYSELNGFTWRRMGPKVGD
jgi:arginyl-tRNA--protein-N-Asp/Glu arginylyltransferase